MNMNKRLHLPPELAGGLAMGQAKIQLLRHEAGQDIVGGSVAPLLPQQTGPNEVTYPVVSVGGVSRTEFLAAQLMPLFLKMRADNISEESEESFFKYAAESAVLAARALQKAANEPVQS